MNWKWAVGLSLTACLIIGNVWQMYQRSQMKADLLQTQANAETWRQKYLWCEQAQDTIIGVGTLHTDTIVIQQVKTDTLIQSGQSVTYNPYVEIDTSKTFGDSCNPLSVNVWAQVWQNGKYKMLIRPEWNPLIPLKESEITQYSLTAAPMLYRGRLGVLAGLSRSKGKNGLFVGVLTDLQYWGGTIGYQWRF